VGYSIAPAGLLHGNPPSMLDNPMVRL